MSEALFSLRVWIEDTDFGGVVYHANYLKYFERARSAWAESLNMGVKEQMATGVLLAVRTATLDYQKPARLDDRLEIISQITRVGKASIDFEQQLFRAGSEKTLLCVGQVRVVCVTPEIKACSLPKEWRRILLAQSSG